MEAHPSRVTADEVITAATPVFREALDQVDEIFIITRSVRDDEDTIIDFEYSYLNAAGLRMMGRPAEEVIGRGLVELFPSHVPTGLFDAYRDAVVSGKPAHVVIPTFDENGVVGSFMVDVRKFGDGYVMVGRDISEQRRREGELRRSREEYRLLAENTSDVVYRTDTRGTFTWVSPSVERTLGWSVEDLVGTNSADLIHTDDLADIKAVSCRDEDGARCTETTLRFRTRDAGYRWMHAISTPLATTDGSIAELAVGLHDVHDQTESKLVLAESSDLFRTAIHSATVGMAVIDPNGVLIEVNTALGTMLGHGGEAFHDMPLDAFIGVEDRPRFHGALRSEGTVVLDDLRLLRRDGGTAWARCAVVALQATNGTPTRHLAQIEDLTAQREAQDLLEYQTFHDPLTGLRNRSWILDILPTELNAAKRAGHALGVLLIDLDQFKVINESLGHTAGDALLVEVARRLVDALPSGYHLCRVGGDEFVVVVPQVTSPADLEALAASIMGRLSAEVVLGNHRVVPSASIGISVSTDLSTGETMLRDADSALYRAKPGASTRWQFADEGMHRAAVERISLVEEIRIGIARKQFVAHFMPIVALGEHRIVGHEALVRWQHPQRGPLPPAAFLSVAEETGLINGIGDLVLEQACSTLLHRPELPGGISVNVSGVQLARPGWFAEFRDILKRFGVAPERIVIEATETAIWNLTASRRDDLISLRELGVGLHLDDFGTGYSPLSLLRDLPVSGLKLDMGFVHGLLDGDRQTVAIANGLADLARALDIAGIAEGIETAEQAMCVQDIGWKLGQGYLYGRAAPHPLTTLD